MNRVTSMSYLSETFVRERTVVSCGLQDLLDAWSRNQRLMLLKSIVGYADASLAPLDEYLPLSKSMPPQLL